MLICSFHFKSSEMLRPNSLKHETCSRSVPSMDTGGHLYTLEVICIFLVLWKSIVLVFVFLAFSFILFSSEMLSTRFATDCILLSSTHEMLSVIVVSSIYLWVGSSTTKLIRMVINNLGPSQDPCTMDPLRSSHGE